MKERRPVALIETLHQPRPTPVKGSLGKPQQRFSTVKGPTPVPISFLCLTANVKFCFAFVDATQSVKSVDVLLMPKIRKKHK